MIVLRQRSELQEYNHKYYEEQKQALGCPYIAKDVGVKKLLQ